MNKILMFTIIGILVFSITWIYMNNAPKSESYIIDQIENSNYCSVKEDCVQFGPSCPFGCSILINKNEEGKIRDLITSFKSDPSNPDCMYKCMEPCQNIECIDNKCEPMCE